MELSKSSSSTSSMTSILSSSPEALCTRIKDPDPDADLLLNLESGLDDAIETLSSPIGVE